MTTDFNINWYDQGGHCHPRGEELECSFRYSSPQVPLVMSQKAQTLPLHITVPSSMGSLCSFLSQSERLRDHWASQPIDFRPTEGKDPLLRMHSPSPIGPCCVSYHTSPLSPQYILCCLLHMTAKPSIQSACMLPMMIQSRAAVNQSEETRTWVALTQTPERGKPREGKELACCADGLSPSPIHSWVLARSRGSHRTLLCDWGLYPVVWGQAGASVCEALLPVTIQQPKMQI